MNNNCVRSRGFTLIEMMIAMTLFSIVMVLAFNAFSLASLSFNKIDQSSERMNQANVVYQFLNKNLPTVGLLSVEDLPEGKAQFTGLEETFTFITELKQNPERKGWYEFTVAFNDDLAVVTVALRPFYPRVNVPDAATETIVLAEAITAFSVHYAAREDSDAELTWHNQWQRKILPKGIKLQLATKDGRYWPDWFFPIKMDGARKNYSTDNVRVILN